MNERIKFPAVIVTKEFLGITEGTVLKFDQYSGKYVSLTEEEDIADELLYYSGYAIAIDPYVVLDNLGDTFVSLEQPEANETIKEPEPTSTIFKNEPPLDCYTESEQAKQEEVNSLVVDCGCGHRSFVTSISAPGITTTLLASDPKSYILLTCDKCGAQLKMWFAKD